MPDVTQALQNLLSDLFSSEESALQFVQAPEETLVAEGFEEGSLTSAELNELASEAAQNAGLSETTQLALASPAASGTAALPVTPVAVSTTPLSLAETAQQLQYFTYVTHEGNQQITETIFNNQQVFDNSVGDVVDNSVDLNDINGDVDLETFNVNATGDGANAAGDDVAVADGDGAVAAGGDLEEVITGDDNQLVDVEGDGNLVAGGDVEGAALGDGSVAAGDDVENANTGDGGVLVDGDNSGAVNTGSVDGVQAGDDAINPITGDNNTANQVADSELDGVAFGEGDASNIDADLSGANISDSGIAIGEQSSAANADLNDVEIEDGALEIGDGFADNVSDVDDGAAVNTGVDGTATGSNLEAAIDDSILDSPDAQQNEVEFEIEVEEEPIEDVPVA